MEDVSTFNGVVFSRWRPDMNTNDYLNHIIIIVCDNYVNNIVMIIIFAHMLELVRMYDFEFCRIVNWEVVYTTPSYS